VKKLAEAMQKAGQGISTFGGGKIEQPTPGAIGVVHGGKVDLGMPTDEATSTPVGNLGGVVIIPPRDSNPEPPAQWPTGNPAVDNAIHDLLAPRRKPKEAA
jgi:hypothetical protein